MTATNTANRFAALTFAMIVSAVAFASAIVPASPTLIA